MRRRSAEFDGSGIKSNRNEPPAARYCIGPYFSPRALSNSPALCFMFESVYLAKLAGCWVPKRQPVLGELKDSHFRAPIRFLYKHRSALRGTPGSACPQPEPNATELPSAPISARTAQRQGGGGGGVARRARAPGPRSPSPAPRPVTRPPQRPAPRRSRARPSCVT